MAGRAAALVLVALATLVALSNGYYVPGTYPQEFLPGAVVQGARQTVVARCEPAMLMPCAARQAAVLYGR
jgi:hypothetical protein